MYNTNSMQFFWCRIVMKFIVVVIIYDWFPGSLKKQSIAQKHIKTVFATHAFMHTILIGKS